MGRTMGDPGQLQVTVVKAVPAPVPPAHLRAVLRAAGAEPEVAARLADVAAGAEPGGPELTLRITGDRELRRLNRRFLGEDRATDVLSFPAGGPGPYLGDVALSWPAVTRQAAEHGHPAEVEAALLVVHGLLHLLGWDHAEQAEERSMTRLTLAALARSGITPAPGRLVAAPGSGPIGTA